MPNEFAHINLIQSKAKGSARLAAIEASLRKSSFISLGVFILLGIVTASAYGYFFIARKNLEMKRDTYIRQINTQTTKEGLLIAIKDRIKIVGGVLAAQRPWAKVLDMLAGVIRSDRISNVSANEQNKIVVGFTVPSLDEVLEPVKALSKLTNEGKIKNPELISVQLDATGSVVITISFSTNF